MKKSADKGHNRSIEYYGDLLYRGYGSKHDKKDAAKYLRIAANAGVLHSMNIYGKTLLFGYKIRKNVKEGQKYLKRSADLGNVDSMFYYAKSQLKSNKKEAFKYFQIAAEKGEPRSNYECGKILCLEKEDLSKKFKAIYHFNHSSLWWYTESKSLFRLGEIYFKMSASIGDVNAMYNYASMNYNGNGIKRNIREAATYFKMAADHGDAESAGIFKILQRQYGNIHYEIKEPYQDLNVRCLNDINIDKNANANYFMGLYYYQNVHVPRDINKAIDYFLLAGNSNHPEAQLILGYIYYQGEFVDQDMNKALHYLHESANNNNKNAQFILGYIYSNQLKDIKKALIVFGVMSVYIIILF